jgi:hypothetical protein
VKIGCGWNWFRIVSNAVALAAMNLRVLLASYWLLSSVEWRHIVGQLAMISRQCVFRLLPSGLRHVVSCCKYFGDCL